MSGALARQPHGELTMAERQFMALERQAKAYAESGLLPPHFRKRPEAVLAVAMTLEAVGVPVTIPTISMFDDIQGRIQPRVQFSIALAAHRGVDVWFDDDECDDTQAVAYGQRRGSDRIHKVTYTIQMAHRAKLTGKDIWKAHTEIMLRYRAAGWLLRTTFPDVALGLPVGVLDGEGIDVPTDRAQLQALAVDVPMVDPDTGEILDAELVDGPGADVGGGTEEPRTSPRDPDSEGLSGPPPADALDAWDREELEHKLAGLDAEHRAIAMAAWKGVGLPRLTEVTKADFDKAQRVLIAAGNTQAATHLARLKEANKAMRAVGVSKDDARHALIREATGGETESSKALTADQLERIKAQCAALAAADASESEEGAA